MNTTPLVSIILPAYNCEKYISRSIDSILNQTYNHIEIIITNDGSSDRTLNIIEQYTKKYPDKIFYSSQENKGPSAARNACLNIAQGRLIAYQDADDISLPERIESQVSFFIDNPDHHMAYTGVRYIYKNGITKNVQATPFNKKTILIQNYIACGSVMHKKEVIEKAGIWNENVDWDLWIRISEHYNIGYIREILYEYHDEVDGISSTRGWEKNFITNIKMFQDRYRRKQEFIILINVILLKIQHKLLKTVDNNTIRNKINFTFRNIIKLLFIFK